MITSYVLHSTCYMETSLIVKFFTKEHGIVNLMARGAKRKKSLLAAILQPFVPLLIYWKPGRLDLATLYHAEAIGIPHRLTGFCLFGSLYINELLLRLLAPLEPHVELFDCYQKFLCNLQNADKITLEKSLRSIEKKLLAAIGYELQLNRENQTGAAIDRQARYYFDFENGLSLQQFAYSSIAEIAGNSISGTSLLALHNECFTNEHELKEAKLFMRHILANFLGNKPLLTRQLFT